jgi:hypothetical protein
MKNNNKEITIYRLFEKNDDTINLIGSNLYFIKISDNRFPWIYEQENIFINYNYDIFIGKQIENIDTFEFDMNNIKSWLEEREFEFINNLNMFTKKFVYKNNFKQEIKTVRLCYTDFLPNIQEWENIEYIDDNLNELIITNLIENKNILKTNDKIMLNELLGENSYIKNNELKFLFKYKKINL